MKVIKAEQLTKYYGKSRGIIGVDLSVEKGDFFGFIGPNGAGKSTFIRTALGLISPTEGSIEIFEKNIQSNKTEILSDIGFLSSEATFYNSMKVRDILSLSAKLRNKNCDAEAALLCKRLDLDPSKRIDQLSLGNRKKVGIVCALQHNPSLYILDEPTSGLDPLMQKEFFDILKERNENGATVFLSSHILSEISRYCKNAAVIKDGRILACDSVSTLSNTGAKRVALKSVSDIKSLESSAYVKDLKKEDDTCTFLFGGNTSELLSLISSLSPADITVTNPDLEEIFMHFYSKEAK